MMGWAHSSDGEYKKCMWTFLRNWSCGRL